MSIQVQAIFENGLLRPLQEVRLAENQQVTVTISAEVAMGETEFVLSVERWQAFCDALDAPPRDLPSLRKLLTQPSVLDGQADPTSDAGSA